eukprot:Gb_15247 [translate_table: standard]
MEVDLNSPHEFYSQTMDDQGENTTHQSSLWLPESPSEMVDRSSICSELWHACAGSLISLPRKGSLVVYFPQGHMEQVAASMNQCAVQQMPLYHLPPQIFCSVLNVNLHADQETDEVYAQLTLVPRSEPLEKFMEEDEEDELSAPATWTPHMFCKTLTASDTSTHGGFSVPRRAAEDCFPPLDYNQQRPSQELVAKDLHGIEWKFRHIYRGQPRRHLLTTGWSAFVSHKRLVSGDAVLFLCGENGDLRLGIRRAARQQSSIPSSMLSSQTIHLGVLAAAAHAVATKSMFHIFYNPRTSPAEFVIPYRKYVKSVNQTLSTGMRFKLKYETEDAAERRYTGTITGTGDADPVRWPGSKWRSIKVEWDEHATNESPERVSAWEIELFVSSTGLNIQAGPRIKKPRTSFPSTPTDGGRLLDLGESLRFQEVLQGQEMVPLKAPLRRDDVDLTACQVQSYNRHDAVNDCVGARAGSNNWPAPPNYFSNNAKCGQLYGSEVLSPSVYLSGKCTDTNQKQMKFFTHLQSRETATSMPLDSAVSASTPWVAPLSLYKSQERDNSELQLSVTSPSPMTSDSHKSDMHCNYWQLFPPHNSAQVGVPIVTADWQAPSIYPCLFEDDVQGGSQGASNLSIKCSKGPKTLIDIPIKQHHLGLEKSHAEDKNKLGVREERSCRLFGFSLIQESECIDDVSSSEIPKGDATSDGLHVTIGLGPVWSSISQNQDQLQKDSGDHCGQSVSLKGLEQEGTFQRGDKAATSVPASGRSLTKVHKQGNAVGRAIDLSKLYGYDELISELEHLFNMEGSLRHPEMGWQVAYTDNEGDMMLVGDDPWQEFCNIVCKILIYTKEEVDKMTPGMLSDDAKSSCREWPAVMEASKCSVDCQDSSSLLETGA